MSDPNTMAAIQVIRHATELGEPIDIVATADASLIPMLMFDTTDTRTGAPFAAWYCRFAGNRLVLAYTDRSQGADLPQRQPLAPGHLPTGRETGFGRSSLRRLWLPGAHGVGLE